MFWTKSCHFVILKTKHKIKELLLQKLLSFVFHLWISNKKCKYSSHMVTKAVIFPLYKLTKIFYKTCSFCYAIQECESQTFRSPYFLILAFIVAVILSLHPFSWIQSPKYCSCSLCSILTPPIYKWSLSRVSGVLSLNFSSIIRNLL